MCEIDDSDYEPCQVWTNTWHTARKPRPCRSCKTVIKPREKYMRHFDIFDGEVNVEFLCAVCGVAAEEFTKEHSGMSQSPAGIRYVLRDCIDNGDEASAARWQPILDNIDKRREEARKTP